MFALSSHQRGAMPLTGHAQQQPSAPFSISCKQRQPPSFKLRLDRFGVPAAISEFDRQTSGGIEYRNAQSSRCLP